MYKRIISVIMLIIMLTILVSCGKKENVPQEDETLEQDTASEQEIKDEEVNKEFAPIRQIGKAVGSIVGSPAKTSHGYYEISPWNNTDFGNIVYTDYETQQTIFLCNVPGCAHNTPDCTSYIPYSRNTTLFTDYSENHLYLWFRGIEANANEDGAPASITEMNMDGSGRRTVLVLPGEERFSQSYMYVAGDEYMYALVEHYEMAKVKSWDFETQTEVEKESPVPTDVIERIWFKDGKREKIRTLKNNNSLYEGLSGTADDKYLLLTCWEYGDNGSIGSKVIIDQNGETVDTIATFRSGEYVYVDDKYKIEVERSNNTATATIEFVKTGETRIIKDIPYPDYAGPAFVFGGYKDKFYLEYLWTESGRDNERALILDFSEGIWKEFDLRLKTNSHYFVTPLAETEKEYLVLIGRVDTTISLVDSEGVPRTYKYVGRNTYALMTKEDFWNSVPNYREIEDKLG